MLYFGKPNKNVHTAAEKADVHMVQKREQEFGHMLNWSRIDLRIVEDALYAARNEGA